MLRVPSFKLCYRNFTNRSSLVDHYAVLGLNTAATAKEVKAAYYKLSKQHHPDTNPNNKDEAAIKFQQVGSLIPIYLSFLVSIFKVLQAYEILGSDELRKIYDLDRQYANADIRRRRLFHSHFEMPEEFYAEFGKVKDEYEETEKVSLITHYSKLFMSNSNFLLQSSSNYKDSRAVKREQEELLREIEKEVVRIPGLNFVTYSKKEGSCHVFFRFLMHHDVRYNFFEGSTTSYVSHPNIRTTYEK
uniref:J domain-containing protein n=1 Tax=Heterorhabditis bacteriophora TaxID=37862 RepID=A0A1I7WAW5_HETBA